MRNGFVPPPGLSLHKFWGKTNIGLKLCSESCKCIFLRTSVSISSYLTFGHADTASVLYTGYSTATFWTSITRGAPTIQTEWRHTVVTQQNRACCVCMWRHTYVNRAPTTVSRCSYSECDGSSTTEMSRANRLTGIYVESSGYSSRCQKAGYT